MVLSLPLVLVVLVIFLFHLRLSKAHHLLNYKVEFLWVKNVDNINDNNGRYCAVAHELTVAAVLLL